MLGEYYFSINDIRRQRDSLKIATKKGRYRSDALVLLSLAQAYGHFKQFKPALKTLKRAESKMGRLKGDGKANIYRTYAEFLRMEYLAQRSKNPLQADLGLLDQALRKWKKLQSMSGGGSQDSRDAAKQIEKIEKLKQEASL